MMGFEKLTEEVGIAYDAPSPEWTLKMMTMSAIMGPKPVPSTPADRPRRRLPRQPLPRRSRRPAAADGRR